MTQIIYQCATATTIDAGGVITTGKVHVLPQWAPPIEYIGTTDPWHCLFLVGSTGSVGGVDASEPGRIRTAKVRAYGRRATLHAGVECFGTDLEVIQQYPTRGAATQLVGPSIMYVLTYRAVGELTRP